MIQRVLYTALQTGLTAIQKDLTILDDIFEDWGLPAAEVANIHTYFKTATPSLIQGYALATTPFPAYCITLQSESEVEKYLGDDEGTIGDRDDEDFGCETYGAQWEHNFQILCYSENPDVTTYIYEIAKTILLLSSPLFDANNIFDRVVSGMDMAPDPRYIPEHLFVRVLGFRCRREFEAIDSASKIGRAFKVSGLFVDRTGSPSDPGIPDTNLTVSTGT